MSPTRPSLAYFCHTVPLPLGRHHLSARRLAGYLRETATGRGTCPKERHLQQDTNGLPWRVQGVAEDEAGEVDVRRSLAGWGFLKRIMEKLGS